MDIYNYLMSMPVPERKAFAARCGTSVGYLRKLKYTGLQVGAKIAIAIERESDGRVRVESVLPDADWAYIRRSGRKQ